MARRKGFDDQGRPVEEVESPTGSFKPDLDTARLRELKADELSLADTQPMQRPHFAPYGTAGDAPPKVDRKRSPLDEMRALSEEIKKRRKE